LKGLAGLRTMIGDFEAARTLMARHRAIMEEIGRKLMLGGSAQMAGYVQMLAGDRAYLPAVAAMLASALEAQGRHAEAERYVESWPRRCGRWVGSTRRPPPWTRRCGATRRRATWSRPDACVPPSRSGGGVRTRGNPRERDEDHFRGSVEPYSFPASAAYASGARLLNLGSRKMRAA
jgi:hypothetical protein